MSNIFLEIKQNDINIEKEYKEFKNRCSLIEEEIESKYLSILKNKRFKSKVSEAKKKWYFVYLRKRIERKIFFKNNINLFNSIMKLTDEIIPIAMEKSFNNFVNIKDLLR